MMMNFDDADDNDDDADDDDDDGSIQQIKFRFRFHSQVFNQMKCYHF